MDKREKIVKILMDEFDYVYCHNCASQDNQNRCDECHRKMMNWSISEDCANGIAQDIMDIFSED